MRILLSILAALACNLPAADLSFQATADRGVQVQKAFRGTADSAGVLKQYTLRLPRFSAAVYYAAYQKHDAVNPNMNSWPDGTNRIQPLPIHDFQNLKPGGMFLVAKLEDNHYLALLPLSGKSTVAWFVSSGADLTLNVGNLGSAPVHADLPLIAWGRAADPYAAARLAWQTAIAHPLIAESTRLRAEKTYPEILRYLGWCSWEEYKASIDEKILLDAVGTIENSALPIRWVLVDDGHLRETNRQLTAFGPNQKFPRGWAPILQRRRPDKIRWMGVWLNFNGYWNGISPQNDLASLAQDLAPLPNGSLSKNPKKASAALEPKPGLEHSFAFYNAMIGSVRDAGFDFVKVDNQAKNLALYRGSAQPVESAIANAKALEFAAAFHMDGLINCMAHGPVSVFNTRVSAVTRCSEDYKVGDLPRAKRHLINSFGNMIWLGQTVWGDHDMFHSDDPVAGRMMAVSKAVSGGPVYLSDNPQKFAVDLIRPLAFSSGELLPVLAPGTALPESLFIDPLDEAKPFRAIAPLPNQAAAVVVYNLTEPERAVTGYVSPEDYRQANALVQPASAPWQAVEGLVLYDWYEKKATPLAARYSFEMPKFSDRLLLLCPVNKGWAVIGRTDKYLSPAAVTILRESAAELMLQSKEPGRVTIWQNDDKAALHSTDAKVRKLAAHLWEAEIPSTATVQIAK